jgi:hypothetical protein
VVDRQAVAPVDADDAWLDVGDDDTHAEAPAEDTSDRPAWSRPEGLEGDALAQWKERQNLPVDADDYEVKLAEGERFSEIGEQMVDSLRTLATELDMPAATPQKLVDWYRKQEQAYRGRLAENDKVVKRATVAALRDTWGDLFAANKAIVDAAFKGLPMTCATL